MGKEKKKSDWDNLSEMLSQDVDAPQNVDDWGADAPSTPVEAETAAESEPEAEKNVVKTSAKTKRACGEKKAKATKTRKKAAPKTDKIDAALATPSDAPQDAETLDLTVAETEKAPKKRRRAAKKAEQDETELVKNVLKLEKETKAKKRARAKTAEVNPFVGLLSQIERVAQDEPTDAATSEPVADVEPTEAEPEPQVETASTPATENVESDDFFADFFADSNVEELEISWGRPQVDEPEAQADPEIADETDAETAPEPTDETEAETPVETEVETAPRRRERRRRRRDDRAPREEAETEPEVVAQTTDDVKTDVDLNDLEAFFATDAEDEGVGFAPRRESKKVEKTEKVEKVVREVEPTADETLGDDAFAADDEGEETRSKRKRRRRRGARRPFDDEADAPTLDDEAETEAEPVDEIAPEPEAYEPERAPRERRRRERRPRREREFDAETTENAAGETLDERRGEAPERVLPSWSDAISHVVRFNMSRRVNRRR